MHRIISKPSATFKNWLVKYLNDDLMDDFIASHVKPFEVLRVNQVKADIQGLRNNVKNVIITIPRLSKKSNRYLLNNINHKRKLIKICQRTISNARLDDLIIHDSTVTNQSEIYHVMKLPDLLELQEKLLKYLLYYVPITYKIKWILKHKTIMDKTLTRKTGIPGQQISNIKARKQSVENVKLGDATRIAEYYNETIKKQLA